MDFTREPIIETIITPKEGYKLVLRSSKSAGQEEYFVDAVEIVSFSNGLFFRSLERPKAFLVPVSDYEVLEVREARMVLKNAGLDRSIKIGGGREGALKASREVEKEETGLAEEREQEEVQPVAETPAEARPEIRVDKKRDRRRHYRKRKGREEVKEEIVEQQTEISVEKVSVSIPPSPEDLASASATPTLLSSLLQPPSTLISETINRYRQNDLFKGAFYLTEEEQYKPHDKVQQLLNEEDEDEEVPSLQEPAFEPEATFAEQSESVKEENKELRTIEKEEQEETEKEEQEEFSFIEREFQLGLSLYAEEEDLSMVVEEPPYIPDTPEQEEEKPANSNQHHFHQEDS